MKFSPSLVFPCIFVSLVLLSVYHQTAEAHAAWPCNVGNRCPKTKVKIYQLHQAKKSRRFFTGRFTLETRVHSKYPVWTNLILLTLVDHNVFLGHSKVTSASETEDALFFGITVQNLGLISFQYLSANCRFSLSRHQNKNKKPFNEWSQEIYTS